MEIFNILIQNPLINVLVAIYQLLMLAHIPYALGFSIILLTVVIRLILYPFTAAQLKTSKKMQDIAPQLNKIREKYKKDAKRLQQETMAVYSANGVNPAAGCLPVLIQLPILFGLYGVLLKIVHLKSVNEVNSLLYTDSLKLKHLWDSHFFGLTIGTDPSKVFSFSEPMTYFILLVPVVTGLFQFIQSKMMTPTAEESSKKKVNKDGTPDFMTTFQTQTLYLFPLMIGFFAFTFPIGLSLYWNTFTLFGIIQQYRIQGLGGLGDWVNKLKK